MDAVFAVAEAALVAVQPGVFGVDSDVAPHHSGAGHCGTLFFNSQEDKMHLHAGFGAGRRRPGFFARGAPLDPGRRLPAPSPAWGWRFIPLCHFIWTAPMSTTSFCWARRMV